MTVIGFCGYAQTGKDSAAEFLAEFGYVRLAFADILRQSLYALNPVITIRPTTGDYGRVQDIVNRDGWELAKTTYPEIRELLQRMGTEVGRELYGESFWVDRVMKQIKPHGKYVITDVRYPNEAAAVRKSGGRVFRVDRPGSAPVNSHLSDSGIDSIIVDGRVSNHGNLSEYRSNVLRAVGIY